MSGMDFSPLVQLLLLGLALGALPLAFWDWRARHLDARQRLRRLTLLALFLTFDLVVFGAFTRLSDSGLGCPDWPGCYGHASPLAAQGQIAAEVAARPEGPVTHGKAWVEMVHRYWASAVGFLILVQAGLALRWRKQLGATAVALAWASLVWVGIQGLFGAWTVTWRLFPAIVTAHLLGGLGLLGLLAGLAWCLQPCPWAARPALRRGLRLALVLLGVQIALGGWVSTNYAVMACPDFPACQGQWWPAMDAAAGFTLWRELGQGPDGQALTATALTAIHLAHRLGALVLSVVLLGLAWALCGPQRRWAQGLLALLALQLVSGISNVVLGWPLVAALAHSAAAAGLLLLLLHLNLGAQSAQHA